MNRSTRLAASTVALCMVLASCGGGGGDDSPSESPPDSVERNVDPATVDSSVETSMQPHVVLNPSSDVSAQHKLFVFLPGTDGVPDQFKLVLRAGAARGFHAIGLNYQNGPLPIGVVCAVSPDPDCFWNTRRETVTGENVSSELDVEPPDSVVVRITKTVTYLDRTYPDEGWGEYVVNGAVDWSKVVVGGHSQGGGHAGVMAKLYSMSRVCYFSSPPDWDEENDRPAAWMSLENVTPASKQFGFTGLSDPSVPYDQLSVIWKTLGLDGFGAAVSVDSKSAPFDGSHTLTTDEQPEASDAVGEPLHGLTVRDVFTPLNANREPVFDPVWGYICFE